MTSAIRWRRPSGTWSRQHRAMTILSSASKSNASRHGEHSSRCRWMASRRSGGQLAVEEVVEGPQRLLAIPATRPFVHVGVACLSVHPGALIWCAPTTASRRLAQPALAAYQNRATSSAAPFFRGAAGSSRCRSGCRGSRRSPCRRNPSTSASSTAMRNCSGRASTAALTSPSVKCSSTSSSALRPALTASRPPRRRYRYRSSTSSMSVCSGRRFASPVGVDERVGQDPVQPGLEVGPLLERPERPVGLQVGLLHQVLGVGGVARHAQGRAVQRAHVLHRQIGKLGLVGHAGHPTLAACDDLGRSLGQGEVRSPVPVGWRLRDVGRHEHERDGARSRLLGDHRRHPDHRPQPDRAVGPQPRRGRRDQHATTPTPPTSPPSPCPGGSGPPPTSRRPSATPTC